MGSKLHLAVQIGDIDMARLLLKNGAKVNGKDIQGLTSLQTAALYNVNVDIARLLIENGAFVNVKDSIGRTPLHHSANNPHSTNVAKLLIENGANLNVTNEYGSTPLHYATYQENVDFARLLIEHGAMINKRNDNEWTPYHYAHAEIEALFNDLDLRKRNIINRLSKDTVTSIESSFNKRLHPRALSDIILAVPTQNDFVNARGVSKAWRSVADSTLEQRPSAFFAFNE
jgi:ankyrin repeat protein